MRAGLYVLGGATAALVVVGCLAFTAAPPTVTVTPTPAPTSTATPGPVNEDPPAVVNEDPAPLVDAPLPPCEYEDSRNCFWDATVRGNGQGRSFVDIGGTVYYTDTPEETPGLPAGSLVCGKDAKPALDYNDHDGWWAYCEPALVDAGVDQ